MEQSLFLAVPHTGQLVAESYSGLAWPTERGRYHVRFGKASLLALNFNKLWVAAEDDRDKLALTDFAMHHSDIQAPALWADRLIDERKRVGADVLSVAVALKDDRGLTTTATRSEDGYVRRFTVHELPKLPPTFFIEDVPGAQPGDVLLVNTGLWVCDFTEEWVGRFPGFCVNDRIVRTPDGKRKVACLSEDWGFSIWCAEQGLRVAATTILPVIHHGTWSWRNDRPWGTWLTDKGDDCGERRKCEAGAD